MSKTDSNDSDATGKSSKPSKPTSDFPLFPPRHRPVGEEDPRADALLCAAGRPRRGAEEVPRTEGRAPLRPRAARGVRGLTVKELANQFLNSKQAIVDSWELTRRSGADYE